MVCQSITRCKINEGPGTIQGVFPGYHGVAWYSLSFIPATKTHPEGRYLLRFWAVDYLAEVWLNGVYAGGHEGGETPFTLDITDIIEQNSENLLVVRVLNPTNEPIDGIILKQTPHRNKAIGLMRWAGKTNIAAACRMFAAKPRLALKLIGAV